MEKGSLNQWGKKRFSFLSKWMLEGEIRRHAHSDARTHTHTRMRRERRGAMTDVFWLLWEGKEKEEERHVSIDKRCSLWQVAECSKQRSLVLTNDRWFGPRERERGRKWVFLHAHCSFREAHLQ